MSGARIGRALACLAFCVALCASAQADPTGGAEAPGAIAAVQVDLDVEGTLLEEDLQRYVELTRARALALSRLGQAYDTHDAALHSTVEDDSAPADIESLMREVELAESDRTKLLARERSLVDQIQQRRRRIELLEEELGELEGRQRKEAGALSGQWDVVLMPIGQRGTFDLSQTGTLVRGTYRLEGGWSGSLQGTLVRRKVYLVRIDSQLGRSMELQGTLAMGGKRIIGTWLRFELAAEQGGTGEWSASKRTD